MSDSIIKERPILFSAPMVRATLEDRKTQTRRVVKGITDPDLFEVLGDSGEGFLHSDKCRSFCDYACGGSIMKYPCGKPGDRLWVKEAHALRADVPADDLEKAKHYCRYKADGDEISEEWHTYPRWRPSIHMPRWASRLTLEITGVRVERLQDISEEDAIAEGADPVNVRVDPIDLPHRAGYARLWDGINVPGSWDANPWVWVIEFRRVEA